MVLKSLKVNLKPAEALDTVSIIKVIDEPVKAEIYSLFNFAIA